MKTVLYFFINLLTITCALFNFEEKLKQEWQQFQIKFNKSYQTPWECSKRREIFKKNFLKIETHNRIKNRKSHTRGLNNFTDWSDEEFLDYLNKYDSFNGKSSYLTLKNNISSSIIPEFVDWRLAAAVTEVKNQGHCGSCWSFSVTGALEGQARIKLGMRTSLSEQNLIDCCTLKYSNHGCNGGNIDATFSCVKDNGITTEDNYPYKAKNGVKCSFKPAEIHVVDVFSIEPTEEDLKKAVATLGPIAAAIEATQELQLYKSGILFDRTCYDNLNHAVLVVGYGVENEEDYWLIKNSWGGSWGEQGYFRLARNKYDNCGIASSAFYASVRKG